MKKLLSILLMFVCQLAQSQTVPQGINYQAVALDQRGQPIPGIDIVGRPIDDAEIGVRIAILENTPTGNILYQEEHEVLTDLYGMFNLVIGQGLQVSVDPFSSINWQGDKFLQVELSIENNGEFVLSAVQQLMSVPYAFLAENAMVAQTAVDVDDADADPSNELQSLSVSGDSLTLSNGNTVQLPALDDADADPNNEIQVLSISNDTLYLSNGGFAILPVDQVNDADADPSNEIQTLTKLGSTISLTNGGSVTVFDGDYNNLSNTPAIPTKTSDLTNDSGFLTTEVDGSTTNELQVLSLSNDTIYLTSGGYVVLPAGFDGDYSSLTNTPTIPSKTSDLTNDSGFLTAEVDGSTSNELQALSISNDTIYLSSGGFVKLPAGFDGAYSSLTGTPALPTKTSDLTNDSGFITAEVDGSTTNELQVLSMSNDTLYLTDGGFVVLPSGFDGDYNNLTNTPAIPSKTSDLTNDSGFITTEQDSSVTNELQTLSISNDTVFLSNGGFIKLPASNNSDSSISNSTTILSLNSDTLIEVPLGQSWVITSIQISPTNPPCESWQADFVRYESSGVVYSGSPETYTVMKLGEEVITKNWGEKWWYGQSNSGPGTTRNRTECFDNSIFSSLSLPFILNPGDSLNLYYSGIIVNCEIYSNTLNNNDVDPSNELQTLSISNDTIFLTDGGFVKLPDSFSSSSSSSESYKTVTDEASGTITIPTGTTDSVTTTLSSPSSTLIVKTWPGGSNLQYNALTSKVRLYNSDGDPVEFYFEETFYRKTVSGSTYAQENDQVNTYYGNKVGPLPTISRNFGYSQNARSYTVRYSQVKIIAKEPVASCRILFTNSNYNNNFSNSITGSYEIQTISQNAQQNTASASLPIDTVVPVNPISGQFWYDYENGQLKSYLNTPSSSKYFRLGQNMTQSSMGTNVSGSWTIYRLTSTQDIYSWGALEGDYNNYSASSSCSGEIKVYLDQDTLFTNGFGNELFSRSSTPVAGGQTLSDLQTFSGLIEENTVIWIIVKHHSCANQYAIQNFSQSIPTEFKDVNVFQSYYDPLIYYATNGFITAATRFPRVSFYYKNISLKWNVIKDFNETF